MHIVYKHTPAKCIHLLYIGHLTDKMILDPLLGKSFYTIHLSECFSRHFSTNLRNVTISMTWNHKHLSPNHRSREGFWTLNLEQATLKRTWPEMSAQSYGLFILVLSSLFLNWSNSWALCSHPVNWFVRSLYHCTEKQMQKANISLDNRTPIWLCDSCRDCRLPSESPKASC